MQIDFFKEECKTTVSLEKFGLNDDSPTSKDPAYVMTDEPEEWIDEVLNSNKTEVDFYAIDNCVEILKPDGKKESKCDCMLCYSNSLLFVELKDRGSQGWLKKGILQLEKTIEKFQENYNVNTYKVEAYVCNKQKPFAVTGVNTKVEKFKDNTGIKLNVYRRIEIV